MSRSYDVAIRTRLYEPDTNIVVRRLGRMRRVLAASPSYLAERGWPREPADLSRHDMLVYNLAADPLSLRLTRGDVERTVRVAATLDCNDGQVIRTAALGGLGILVQPLYIVQGDIDAGRLTPVLLDWRLPMLTMNIAFQNRERLPAKIRVFTDYLASYMRKSSNSEIWSA